MSDLIEGVSRLNPFRKAVDKDDEGDVVDSGTIAGGGHAARPTAITKTSLRVSHSLKEFLLAEKILGEHEIGLDTQETTPALQEFLDLSHINVPPEVTDRNFPLPNYFISSSHNTYLLAHQLYGESSASAYETALSSGSRCVEIDAWDGEDPESPKVTHGYTLVSHIPFRKVCETIRDVIDKETAEGTNAAPIMLSLENHCSPHGQLRLAQIMKEVWGDRLLSKALRERTHENQGPEEHVTLADLGSKIVVIVEYHLPNEQDSDDEQADFEDEGLRKEYQQYRQQKKQVQAGAIIPELAELGVYAQSVKPVNNSWYESALQNGPHHHLINVSETSLKGHMPINNTKIARHNSQHLMRVYPKGSRITSQNFQPIPFWGLGAQICALNWQTFSVSSQVNEALFSGSAGYVLKPPALRIGGSGNLNNGRKKLLRLHVAGATDIPLPPGRDDDIKPYLTCTLLHPSDLTGEPPKRKTATYKPHKLTGFLHKDNPPATDPIWQEALDWEYEDNDLVFLRLLIKSDDKFASNPTFAIACIRLFYAVREWRFIRMLDLKGHETKCTVLCKIETRDI